MSDHAWLRILKQRAIELGYTITVSPDGTEETVTRPDGTVALTAVKRRDDAGEFWSWASDMSDTADRVRYDEPRTTRGRNGGIP